MASRFHVPVWVGECQGPFDPQNERCRQRMEGIRLRMERFRDTDPEVCIVIPAYNEEADLLNTLDTLSKQETQYHTRILVVNNNSTDRTQEILDRCGVISIFEPRQGISFTRQTGLEHALGSFYLSADADSLYPSGWLNAHVEALNLPGVACSYGQHSFLPEAGESRFWLASYELVAEWYFNYRRLRAKEYLNVLGFNFAVRRQDAIQAGGFNTNRQRWQDGWMAMQMQKMGRLHKVASSHGRVWTSSRRLKADGSLFQAFSTRLGIHFAKLYRYQKQAKSQVASKSSTKA